MAANLSVRVDDKAARKLLKGSRATFSRAATTALNRAGASSRVAATNALADAIAEETRPKLQKTKVRKLFRVIKASRRSLAFQISIARLGIGLGRYSPVQTTRGVMVSLPTGSTLVKGAFIAKGKGARHKSVFVRTGRRRGALRSVRRGKNKGKTYKPGLPIRRLSTSAGLGRKSDKVAIPAANKRMAQQWPKEFERAVANIDRRYQKKVGR